MKQVGIKSEKWYKISSLYGLKHDISLVCREYKSGTCIYIIKCIIIYNINGKENRKVYKQTYLTKESALKALKSTIFDITFDNIDFQIDLI